MKTVNAKIYCAAVLLGMCVTAGSAVRVYAQEPAMAATATSKPVEKKEAAKNENDEYLHSPTVVALGRKLGMEPETAATVFTWVNFGVLAVLVLGFLAKSLPKTFKTRSAQIQKDLVDARTATEEAKGRLSVVEERLGRLDGEIAAMKQQAEAEAAKDAERLEAVVAEETKKILAAAEAEIQAASSMAKRDIQRYAAELAVEQAARKLTISAETDRLLVEGFAQRLAADAKGGAN